MRIAILSYSFLPKLGGGEIVLSELASYLSKMGNTVFVISNCKGPVEAVKNYPVYRTPHFCREGISRITHLLVAPFMLLFIHLMNRIDVVQAAGLIDLFAALPIKLIFRVPIVLRLSIWNHPDIVKRLRTAVSAADVIITLNNNMRDEVIEADFNENQVVVIPNGVDINRFRPAHALLVDRCKIVLLWVGRLDSDKRPHLAIETLLLVKNAYDNICLQIVGEGHMEEQLREMVSRYGLQDSVKFLGCQNHDEVAKIMRNADIFLMTSKGEGMSNALLEAMACGMTVVAPSASAIDVIQNGFNGFIASDPKEMSSVILKLIANTSLRRKIRENARRTVLGRFSINRMTANYLQIYQKLRQK